MWLPYFLTHLHFAINIFAALIFAAAAWLYFDAWSNHKSFRESLRFFSFILLATSFAVSSAQTETSFFGPSILPENTLFWTLLGTRVVAYMFLVLSHILDPLQPKPQVSAFIPPLLLKPLSFLAAPLLSFTVAILYLRRSTTGLEKHLRPVSTVFFLLAIHELITVATLWPNVSQVTLSQLIAPYGPLWITKHLILLILALVLRHWVNNYLLKRFSSQLVITFTSLTLVVFLTTSVSFTAILLKNQANQNLDQMVTSAKVLQLAMDNQKQTLLSDTQNMAQNENLLSAINSQKYSNEITSLQALLINKKSTTLTLVSPEGVVMARGENSEKHGDSVSDNPSFISALAGNSFVSFSLVPGPISSQVALTASTPVYSSDKKLIAVIISTNILDNAYLDNLKKTTGLNASLYGGSQLSATTFTTPDGSTRPIGIKETSNIVNITVLNKDMPFVGSSNFLGRTYLASYLPLHDASNKPMGMLFVGQDESSLFYSAGSAIQITLLVTLLLLVLSLIPSFLVANSLTRQIK